MMKTAAQFLRHPASRLLLLLWAALVLAAPAQAQSAYPDKPVRIIVAYAPGGVADLLARALGVELGKALGQGVIVENKVGAGGLIGTNACKDAAPDGYTLCIASTSSITLAPMLIKAAHYDGLKNFTPISLLANFPGVLSVSPKLGVKTTDDFLRWAKAHPGAGFGSSGIGTVFYFMALNINFEHGTKLEPINYKGGSQAVADVVAGNLPMVVDALTASLPFIKSGALVPIMQSGASRSAVLPDVPTAAETLLPRFKADSFQGVFGPAGLPPDVTAKLSAAIQRVGANPEFRKRIADMGGVAVIGTPQEFAAELRESSVLFQQMVRQSGMKPE